MDYYAIPRELIKPYVNELFFYQPPEIQIRQFKRILQANGFRSIDEWFKSETKSLTDKTPANYQSFSNWPFLAERIAKFSKPTDTGLGDTLERVFAKFGGRQFKWFMDRLGIDCGCGERQAYLNALFPYPKEEPAGGIAPPEERGEAMTPATSD